MSEPTKKDSMAVLADFNIKKYSEELIRTGPPAIIVGEKSTILYVNPLMCKLSEYSEDELLGSSLKMLVPNRIKPQHDKLVQAYKNNPTDRRMGPESRVTLLTKSGKERFVEIKLGKLNGSGNTIASVTDITDLMELNTKLDESLSKKTELIKKLEKDAEGARNYNLKMEELKAKNSLKKDEMRAANKVRLISLLIIIIPIFGVLTMMLLREKAISDQMYTVFGTVTGMLVSGFLKELLTGK